jgi:hypothetical protein
MSLASRGEWRKTSCHYAAEEFNVILGRYWSLAALGSDCFIWGKRKTTNAQDRRV